MNEINQLHSLQTIKDKIRKRKITYIFKIYLSANELFLQYLKI